MSKKSKSTARQNRVVGNYPVAQKNRVIGELPTDDQSPLILASPENPKKMKHDLIIPYLKAGCLPPIMTKEQLSDLSGIPLGVITNWVNRGKLPTVKVGKHRIINNIALLVMLDGDLA